MSLELQTDEVVSDSRSSKHQPSLELRAALEAATLAASVIRAAYGQNPQVTIKADQSPVTSADLAAEKAIRALLSDRFPTHAFYGEETGRSLGSESAPLWIVDPIDGTRCFIAGYPMFSTQIALAHQGHMQIGVSSAPVYGELAYAQRGGRAYLNGAAIHVSSVADLNQAAISVGNIRRLAASPRWAQYGRLVERVAYSRGYGDFLHYHLLAAGKLDAVIEDGIQIYDIAALVAIVEAAGGCCTQIDGAPITESSTSVIATNGLLHPEIVNALN